MSLKAKIEAVIYAAEEPVTLPQIVVLLGHEAQSELDHLASAQRFLALEASSSPAPDSDLGQPTDLASIESGSLPTDPASADPGNPEAADQASPLEATLSLPPEPTDEQPDERQLARELRAREARLREFFRDLLAELVQDYSTSDRGLEIREVAGGFRLATKPEYHDAVRGFVKRLKPPLKLSLQALETLAVVAYKQPVTAPELSEIRGVDSGGVLGSLLARKLITTAGRKQVIGRPILYKTTRDFLLRFGLKDINELPSIEEFETMAGELANQDLIADPNQEQFPNQEDIPMQDATPNISVETTPVDTPQSVTGANLEEERDSTEPQADGDSSDNSVADDASIDGRLAGLPPTYDNNVGDAAEVDSPAGDAGIQSQPGSDR